LEEENMKAKLALYWASTSLLAFVLLAAGYADFSHAPDMVKGMTHLGYPFYFLTILGSWKMLGSVAILVPGFARLKEWAYAGVTFTFTGAFFSHLSAGDTLTTAAPPVVLLIVAATSWALRPESRRL
jgi:uncharacterized membrane protein YphA (DoxX/SURF4 family)